MALDDFIVKTATKDQAHEVVLRNAGYWGTKTGIPVDDFVELSAAVREGVFARDGRHTVWVLAPEDDPDTTNFYASCQIFTREVLTLRPGQTSPSSSFGHVMSAVLVPEEYRGKGYAKQLMSLLHSVVAPHRYPNPLKVPSIISHPSTVSVLYSAIGDYYSHCVPSAGESGWSIQKSFITTWPLSSIHISPSKRDSLPIELLSESDVTAVLESDDLKIPTDMLELRKKDPTKLYFAFAPTAPLNAYSIILSKFTPGSPSDPPSLKLVITRLRARPNSFKVLLDAAHRAAQDAKCDAIEVWNVPKHLEEVVQETGGETVERESNLSSFKWYGEQPDSIVNNADIIWALDERYNWC
ncbi:unnamed protein product [Rhizoctonia solani]|uniref:LYC1 C-terminal domain-containing protein n=1 Tax=Rhizoctonia solani TaxID=456999 RepID=A0A8H2XJG7_9AGAM|nr:unnamed protein product [Rhizoctonia solani]